jgi:(2Fe-2S) ferredoxin
VSENASEPGPPFKRHLLICTGSSCSERGAADVRDALKGEIRKQGLERDVRTTKCTCLDLCTSGPNLVVYPEGTWYSGVTVKDVPEIVRSHLAGGRPVTRLIHSWAAPRIDEDSFLL